MQSGSAHTTAMQPVRQTSAVPLQHSSQDVGLSELDAEGGGGAKEGA